MKRNTIYFLLLMNACTGMLFSGCTKAPNGYLSSYIYYQQYLVVVPRGLPFASLNNNIIDGGSTPPFQIKMTHVYDSTGNNMDNVFFKKYPVTIWTSVYNPYVDTTIQMVTAIQKQVDTFAIGLNSAGGRLETNAASVNLPLGTYVYDMQVTNSAGTKTYLKVGSFQLVDPPVYALSGVTESMRVPLTTASAGSGKTPAVTITQTGADPSQRTIILKVIDKNGKPFNPSAGEIGNYAIPSGASFYPGFRNFSIGSSNTDSTTAYQFPVTPFPYYLASGIYSSNNSTIYLTIPAWALQFDGKQPAQYSGLVYFAVNINFPGTYTMTVQLLDVTHS